MATLSPLLKVKVDELFLHWLSSPDTQHQLQRDLKKISLGYSPPVSPQLSTHAKSNTSCLGLRPISPPAPPPLSSPGRSPISPRRRTSSSISSHHTPLTKKDSARRRSKKAKKNDEIVPGCARNMPQFFYPFGEPNDGLDIKKTELKIVSHVFAKVTNGKATCSTFTDVVKVLRLPLYWKYPLYAACGGVQNGFATYADLVRVWGEVTKICHDEPSRFFKLLAPEGQNYITQEDLTGFIQDVIETHPGLTFLQDAPEFHSRYVTTVVSRMFYSINRSWTGRITLHEIRKSNFLEVLVSLEEEDDINEVLDFFSYEQFYVIYCKFWELDTDHDLIIDKKDLSRYSNGALTSRIIERIFSGSVTRGREFQEGKMTYADFVWFLLSEVDKKQPTSIEYWFRCMDTDGDGIISMFELEHFYEEQLEKMQRLGIEALSFPDCLCQTIDMVNPQVEGKITLKDLKRCKHVVLFFDTYFNLDRWLDYEQRDPFQAAREIEESGCEEMTEWEKYAMQEYEILVNEEGATQDANYEDDFELDDDLEADDVAALGKSKSTDKNSETFNFINIGPDSDDSDDSTFY
eukprot:gene11219-12397_t